MVLLIFDVILFLGLCYIIYFFCSSLLNKVVGVDSSWGSSYECGFFSSVLSLDCFSFTYFSLLIIFVIFDLEVSLLLNMPTQGLLFYNFSYYYIFLILLVVSFLSELFNGYISWMY
uniref:NADH-ubiquinone oxidoreductase chain 3 n=1 Tax=Taenia arctos TaxID=749910 RepID=A0A068PRY2_9CEST|nr:NADH dehydrogenase subunit 3 [Taenia arctos]BAP10797.1 NADH dehydrogenase subunit 3 [Taenia arctos]